MKFYIAGLIVEMWEAKTLTQQNGNLRTTNVTTVSNDLSEIEFSFDENPSGTKSSATSHRADEMAETTQNIHRVHRVLTPDVIARIQALDKEDDIATCQTEITSRKIPHRANYKLGADFTGDSSRHVIEMKDGDRLDDSGRFIIRSVVIVKNSASPLGFFIRQGDGLFKKHGIFVSRVTQGSIVDANGLLKVGDEIIAVNYVDIEGFNLDDVVQMIQAPRKLILTIRINTFLIKRSSSVGDAYSSVPTNINQKAEKTTSKTLKIKGKQSRADDYKEPSSKGKQTEQTETVNFKVDNNANEHRDVLKSSVHSEDSATIEDLINAIRAQNNRSKKSRRNFEHGENNSAQSSEDPRNSTGSLCKQKDLNKAENPQIRKPSNDGIILSTRTAQIASRKSSTLTPVTSVNLIFDDPDDFTVSAPPTKHSISNEESLKVYSSGISSRSPPGSPGGSPKARRRLPSVPGDTARTSRCNSDSPSESGSPTPNKPLLSLPAEPRSRRMLPTPPPSPVAPHKAELSNSRKTSSTTGENPESGKSNRNSWSGSVDSETMEEKSPAPSPSRKESGLSLSQIFGAFALRTHPDATDAPDKSKDGGKTESSSPQTPMRKSESHRDDILVRQRHSLLLHSYVSGGLQPPSGPKRLTSRSSQPNLKLLMPVQEEPAKSKLSTASPGSHESSKFSPKLTRRRASLASITDKSLTNQLPTQDLNDAERLRSEAETGFLIFPDDYTGHNLLSSHAVSGMVSLHIIKATHLPFADKKLLEKKKKVYCAVEVDFERKAFTSTKRASKTLTWDEVFEVEVQHGREVCLSCFISSHEFDKPVAKASFNLSPFVRCGQQHNVVFRMHPQGAIHLKMEFIEMKTLLKRAPSDRISGVFGFQLNVTSRNDNASVPLIVRKCVDEIENRGLLAVGLYRISGNARRKRQLKAQFDEDSTTVDLSEDNYPDINVIAGILKDYLRELPEPLITESLSKLLINAAKEQVQDQDLASQKRVLSKLLVQLPQNNRETLVYLLNHFLRVIAEKETNKMDAHNLSVCFGPVLLCPPANLTEGKDLLDLKLHIKIVEFLIYLWKNTSVTPG